MGLNTFSSGRLELLVRTIILSNILLIDIGPEVVDQPQLGSFGYSWLGWGVILLAVRSLMLR